MKPTITLVLTLSGLASTGSALAQGPAEPSAIRAPQTGAATPAVTRNEPRSIEDPKAPDLRRRKADDPRGKTDTRDTDPRHSRDMDPRHSRAAAGKGAPLAEPAKTPSAVVGRDSLTASPDTGGRAHSTGPIEPEKSTPPAKPAREPR